MATQKEIRSFWQAHHRFISTENPPILADFRRSEPQACALRDFASFGAMQFFAIRLIQTVRLLAFGYFALPMANADWPHFLGLKQDNTSSETGLLAEIHASGPKVLWEIPKGKGHACPVVAGDRVFLFDANDGRERVRCVDAASGKELWKQEYAAEFTPQFGAGEGPRSSPVIAGDRVIVHGITHLLQCLDAATGRVIWKRDLAKEFDVLPVFFGAGGTPLVHKDLVVLPLGTEKKESVVAFDLATGKTRWTARHAWGASYSSPISAVIHGRDCILAFQGGMDDPPTGGLLCIDAKDGAVLNATPHRARMFASVSISAPVAFGDRVFVAEAYTEGGVCVEIAPDFSARVAWRAPKFDTYLNTAIHHDGLIFGFAGQHQQNAALVCTDAATGREVWRDDLGGAYQRGTLVRVDGRYLCLGENGDLAWLQLSGMGARVLSHAKLFHAPETWTPPVVSAGRLFVCQNSPGSKGTGPRTICYDFSR